MLFYFFHKFFLLFCHLGIFKWRMKCEKGAKKIFFSKLREVKSANIILNRAQINRSGSLDTICVYVLWVSVVDNKRFSILFDPICLTSILFAESNIFHARRAISVIIPHFTRLWQRPSAQTIICHRWCSCHCWFSFLSFGMSLFILCWTKRQRSNGRSLFTILTCELAMLSYWIFLSFSHSFLDKHMRSVFLFSLSILNVR